MTIDGKKNMLFDRQMNEVVITWLNKVFNYEK